MKKLAVPCDFICVNLSKKIAFLDKWTIQDKRIFQFEPVMPEIARLINQINKQIIQPY